MENKDSLNYAIYNHYKNDYDFKAVYIKSLGSLKGFKDYLKITLNTFINDFDIYLDKPYLDVSWFKFNGRYIDIDLLYDIFKDYLKESRENKNIKKGY